jgi:hypothetical protein
MGRKRNLVSATLLKETGEEKLERYCNKCRTLYTPGHRTWCRNCFRDYYRTYRRQGKCKCGRPFCGIGHKGAVGGRPHSNGTPSVLVGNARSILAKEGRDSLIHKSEKARETEELISRYGSLGLGQRRVHGTVDER